jgi:hypothetical protein
MSAFTIVDNGLDAQGDPVRPIVVRWDMTAGCWGATSAAVGTKHLVARGWLTTFYRGPYTSGGYGSDAFDFDLVA